MEINQVYNRELKEYFVNTAIGVLMQSTRSPCGRDAAELE